MKYKLYQPQAINELGNRKNQEDTVFPALGTATPDSHLFLVCDGMGGYARGEVASATVSKAVCDYINGRHDFDTPLDDQLFAAALSSAYDALDQADQQKTAALTGVSFEEGKLGVVSLSGETGAFAEYYTERLPVNFHGTGDIYSSAAVGALLSGMSVPEALALAADYTAECIRLTLQEENHSWYGVNFEQATPYLLKRLGL